MAFQIAPPLLPMLAKRVASIPTGDSWIFEPKWDGFRVLLFRDGSDLLLQSRDGKSLNRYFPELIDTLKQQLPARFTLDGEIVIADRSGLNFDALQLRVHPAASRVNLLSQQTPASIVFFDMLSIRDSDLTRVPFTQRRDELQKLFSNITPPLYLTPATDDSRVATDWFSRFEGAGFDGVIAKAAEGFYEPNKRTMLKVKHERDCDCVAAGFRWYKHGDHTMIGSLLLGLYNDEGSLQHVGVCASFTQAKRQELVDYLHPYRRLEDEPHPWAGDLETSADGSQRLPGGKSRWSQGKDLSWIALRPELVVEVAYEHIQGDRFRHMAQFRRWRLDKQPSDCTYAQLEVVSPQELMEIFKSSR